MNCSKKRKLLSSFLNFVEKNDGELFIVGDLLELWYCRLESIFAEHGELLGRLAEMDCTYILGNHDDDLVQLAEKTTISHSLFDKISRPVVRTLGDKTFKFMHGHEVDPFIRKHSRTLCRVFSPFVNLLNPKNGSTTLAYDVCSDLALEIGEAALAVYNRLGELTRRATDDCLAMLPNEEIAFLKRHSRTKKMLRRYREDLQQGFYDIAVVGHTHKAGRFSNWYFNSGSWTADRSNYLYIEPDGSIEVFNWGSFGPESNDTCIGK
ncbi:MAG: metallophosphoesterase [Phycisphaerae bacterium]